MIEINPFYGKNIHFSHFAKNRHELFQIVGNLGGCGSDDQINSAIDYIVLSNVVLEDKKLYSATMKKIDKNKSVTVLTEDAFYLIIEKIETIKKAK